MIWTKEFWKGAGERALKTFLEVFVPTTLVALGATAEGVLNAWTAPWLTALQAGTGLALGATAISVLISLGNAEFVAGNVLTAKVEPYDNGGFLPGVMSGGAGKAPGSYEDEIVAGRVLPDAEASTDITEGR